MQVISPTPAIGVVEVVDGLHLVQDKTYDVPTVLIAQQVGVCLTRMVHRAWCMAG